MMPTPQAHQWIFPPCLFPTADQRPAAVYPAQRARAQHATPPLSRPRPPVALPRAGFHSAGGRQARGQSVHAATPNPSSSGFCRMVLRYCRCRERTACPVGQGFGAARKPTWQPLGQQTQGLPTCPRQLARGPAPWPALHSPAKRPMHVEFMHRSASPPQTCHSLTICQVKDQRFPDPKGNLSAFPNWDHSPAFTSDEKQAAIAQVGGTDGRRPQSCHASHREPVWAHVSPRVHTAGQVQRHGARSRAAR